MRLSGRTLHTGEESSCATKYSAQKFSTSKAQVPCFCGTTPVSKRSRVELFPCASHSAYLGMKTGRMCCLRKIVRNPPLLTRLTCTTYKSVKRLDVRLCVQYSRPRCTSRINMPGVRWKFPTSAYGFLAADHIILFLHGNTDHLAAEPLIHHITGIGIVRVI